MNREGREDMNREGRGGGHEQGGEEDITGKGGKYGWTKTLSCDITFIPLSMPSSTRASALST